VGNPFFQRRRAGSQAAAGAEGAAASEFAATVAAPIPSTAMALRLADGRPLGAPLGPGDAMTATSLAPAREHAAEPWAGRGPGGPTPGAANGARADGTAGATAWPADPGLATAPPSDFGASGLDSDLSDHGPGATMPDILIDLPHTAVLRRSGLAPGAGGGTGTTDAATAPTLHHVGRYALKSLLGQGGLGRVHEAWDPLLSRTVAVKTLHFDLDVPTRVSLDGLFLHEARAVAGLSHPYIVTVYDAGLSAHGVYIAMERLRGRDLRQALAGGWQPAPAQAALLVRRVADALAYAHARGVVHCDIKPANIFLNKRGKPKVLDFGIARVAHGVAQGRAAGAGGAVAAGGSAALAAGWPAGGPATGPAHAPAGGSPETDAVMGSPHYLAPEQLAGGVVDGRTDVCALGVVFHELLTGRKAFAGRSLAQITDAVLHHVPPLAHVLQPAVPPALSAIAARAMSRQPEDRYASAAEMAAALREWLAAQPAEGARAGGAAPGRPAAPAAHAVPAAPAGAGPGRAGGWSIATGRAAGTPPWRRPRTLALAGAAVLIGIALLLALRPTAPTDAAVGPASGNPMAAGVVGAAPAARDPAGAHLPTALAGAPGLAAADAAPPPTRALR